MEIAGLGGITCSEIFEVYHRKRITFMGVSDSGNVVVKLFFSKRGACRHWKRSDRGSREFLKRGIPAPGILFSGYLPAYGFYAIVLEYLEGGTGLDRVMEGMSDPEKRRACLEALLSAVAAQHSRGIVQKDIHMGNFVMRGGEVFSLDGDLVRGMPGPLDRGQSLMHVAWLFANHFDAFGPDVQRWWEAYCRNRGWVISENDAGILSEEILRIRRRNFSKTMGKVFRTWGPYLARKGKGFLSVYDNHTAIVAYETLLKLSQDKSHRGRGGHGRVFREVHADGVHLLMYSSQGYGPGAARGFWPACRIWKYACMLRWLGIRTPVPVALICRKTGVLRHECTVFFHMEKGDGLRGFFRSGEISREDKGAVAARFAGACATMKTFGLFFDRLVPDEVVVSGGDVVFCGLDALGEATHGGRRWARTLHAFLGECRDEPDTRGVLTGEFQKKGLLPYAPGTGGS
jgi:tRNA A-37 threonylcarbamoyl transferase component Bud32